MVIQGTWDDEPLYQLPHFGPEEVDACHERRLGNLSKPQDLIRLEPRSLMYVADVLEFSSQQIHDIAEVEKRVFSVTPSLSYKVIPVGNPDPSDTTVYCNSAVTLEVRIRARYDPSFEDAANAVENPTPELIGSLKHVRPNNAIRFRGKSTNPRAKKSTLPEAAAEEVKEAEAEAEEVKVKAEEEVKKSEKKEEENAAELKQYVHAPYFCEHRLERWWLLFAEASKKILVGVERTELPDVIEWEGDDQEECVIVKKIQFPAPPEPKMWQFTLSLICESYIGRDIQVTVPINVKKLDEAALKAMRIPGDEDEDDDDDDDFDYSSSEDEDDKKDSDDDEEEEDSDDDEDEDDEDRMVDEEEEEKMKKRKGGNQKKGNNNNNNNKRKQRK